MEKKLNLLKSVLSVPTHTYREEQMVQYICDYLKDKNINFVVDEHLNIYATKGVIRENEKYPCVVCHTDTVHPIDSINVFEEMLPNAHKELKPSLKAYNDHGEPTGIGGDDKCGVFACMTLLDEMETLKAAFFVSEETGCHGSKYADPSFFSNVGYAIQFDAPENWMITETCFGTRLFEKGGEFHNVCDKVLSESMNEKKEFMNHPYTDVYALKNLFDFSCINISIGYYQYHTRNEYVVIEDVFNGIDMGKKMIQDLGLKKYELSPQKSPSFRYW